jgi:hypothetical protein
MYGSRRKLDRLQETFKAGSYLFLQTTAFQRFSFIGEGKP